MMNLNALKIDPEFQGKIPPLNFEEEQQLEQNILHEGRLLNPIIIWNGFILDGHTRYRILRKHPFIVYQIQEIKRLTATQLSHGSARTSLDAEISTRNGRSF